MMSPSGLRACALLVVVMAVGLTVGLASGVALTARAALTFDPPSGWVSRPSSSTMRVAEFSLPKTGSDSEDAELIVYFFGSGQGGTVQANLDRWVSQMAQPGGRASAEVAKTTSLRTKSGLAVTLLDVTGTYVAEGTARCDRTAQQAWFPAEGRGHPDARRSVLRQAHRPGGDGRAMGRVVCGVPAECERVRRPQILRPGSCGCEVSTNTTVPSAPTTNAASKGSVGARCHSSPPTTPAGTTSRFLTA